MKTVAGTRPFRDVPDCAAIGWTGGVQHLEHSTANQPDDRFPEIDFGVLVPAPHRLPHTTTGYL